MTPAYEDLQKAVGNKLAKMYCALSSQNKQKDTGLSGRYS